MKAVSFAVITVDNIVKTYFLEFRDHIFTASIDNHGDGGSKLLRNVGQCLPYYLVQHPKSQPSSLGSLLLVWMNRFRKVIILSLVKRMVSNNTRAVIFNLFFSHTAVTNKTFTPTTTY
jgi:hypothetical protein